MIKLNVGCGPDIKPVGKGWVNIDGNQNEGVNLVIDLANQELPFPPNTVDHILAQNIIEHISRHKQKKFVTNLYDKLKIGGTITIEMPNLCAIARRYLSIVIDGDEDTLTTEQAAGFLFGAQEDDFGCHRWIYDEDSLRKLLEEIGFVIYYMDEIRGTNLICKAIKSNKEWVKDAVIDTANISDSCFVMRQPDNGNAHNVFILLAVRLAQYGRVFIIGGDRCIEFEHENIINITNMLPGVDEPLYDHDVRPLVLRASCYIDELTSMSNFALKAKISTLCLLDNQSGFIVNGIYAELGYLTPGEQVDFKDIVKWITQED